MMRRQTVVLALAWLLASPSTHATVIRHGEALGYYPHGSESPSWTRAVIESPAVAGQPDAAAMTAVRAVALGIIDADNRGDVDEVMKFYAQDSVLMPPASDPVQGSATIRDRYQALFRDFTAQLEGVVDAVQVEGGMGFVRGRNRGRFVPKGQGQVRQVADVYLMVVTRGADATWRISHLMWHPER